MAARPRLHPPSILFICNTQMQVVSALSLLESYARDYTADIAISNHSIGSRIIYEQLKASNRFRNVFYIDTFDYTRDLVPPPGSLQDVRRRIFTRKYVQKFLPSTEKYDVVSLYNLDPFACDFVESLHSRNGLEVWLLDEGVGSYTTLGMDISKVAETPLGKKARFLRRILRRPPLTQYLSRLFLFDPDLLAWDCSFSVYRLPKLALTNTTLAAELLTFSSQPCSAPAKYDKPYIFLEQPFGHAESNEATAILLEQVAQIVGRENILIKLHPRSRSDNYEDLGYSTIRDFRPWELAVAQDPGFLDGKVLIGVSSSAVLSPLIVSGVKVRGILLYKLYATLTPELPLNQTYEELFKKAQEMHMTHIFLPKTATELRHTLLSQTGSSSNLAGEPRVTQDMDRNSSHPQAERLDSD